MDIVRNTSKHKNLGMFNKTLISLMVDLIMAVKRILKIRLKFISNVLYYITPVILASFLVICLYGTSYATIIPQKNGADAESSQSSSESSVEEDDKTNTHDGLGVIEYHLQAIKNKYESQLWQTLTLRKQKEYASPSSYWRYVQNEYKPLKRHISFSLLGIETQGDNQIYKIMIFGRDGKSTLAIFRLKVSHDGLWKIDDLKIIGGEETPI